MTEIKYLPDPECDNLLDLEPFKNVTCIVSDIDGTMTSGGKELSGQIKDFLKSKYTKDIYFTIATGRTYHGAKDILEQLKLKTGTIIALYNGGIILRYGTNEVLNASFISNNKAKELVCNLYNYNTNIYLYCFNKANDSFFMTENELGEEIIERVYGFGLNSKVQFDVNNQFVVWTDKNADLSKMSIVSILISIENLTINEINSITQICKGYKSFNVTTSGNGFVEITSSNANKGNLVSIIRGEQSQSVPTVILAAGDNDNDVEMFNESDIRVAVSNASNKLLQVTDYICRNRAESGFIDLLNTIINAKKYLI